VVKKHNKKAQILTVHSINIRKKHAIDIIVEVML
jgi:hypothetical protein